METQVRADIPKTRTIHIFGGATEGAPGNNPYSIETAMQLKELAGTELSKFETVLHLTDSAGGTENIRTDEDLKRVVDSVAADLDTRAVFWLPESGRSHEMARSFRNDSYNGMKPRKDIFVVGMVATEGAKGKEQFISALEWEKTAGINLAFARDTITGNSMVVAPEEAAYGENTDAMVPLSWLTKMVYWRTQNNFTRSSVVDHEPVGWDSPLIPANLKQVVETCISQHAYKEVNGVTAGHFAAKIGPQEFLTSIRKTNFNELKETGMVLVETDGPDNVIAYGPKPSVGGQSQRIVFAEHPDTESIVHFHCPIREGSDVPVMSQWQYECGSHECGQNTSNGLELLDPAEGIWGVYLNNHGPNVVFDGDTNPETVTEFLNDNFRLDKKTGYPGQRTTAEVA